jgi:hypothetical protein
MNASCDTLDVMRQVRGVQCVIGFLPECTGLFPSTPQYGTDRSSSVVGERLDHSLLTALVGRSQRAVVMDSDSPCCAGIYLPGI